MARTPPKWQQRLESKLKLLPARPGVYLLKDGSGGILYVGKAKRLPSRVRSYFRGEPHDPRLMQLRDSIRDLDYVVTASEAEALILEANLVRSHRPRFNIELKDDKSFPFIKVTIHQPFPRMAVTRKVVADGSRYFGPFVRVKEMRQVLRSLRRLFPLRSCTDRRLKQGGRPCLEHAINLCPAPCVGNISEEDYRKTVERLIDFLEGNDRQVVAEWRGQMDALSEKLRFEECARLRDDIERVKVLHQHQRMTDHERPDLDAVGLVTRAGRAVAAVFSHREGRVVGAWRLVAHSADQAPEDEIMRTFFAEHYQGRGQIPPVVICNRLPDDKALITGWLTDKAGRRVRLEQPKRGPRAELLRAAVENASLALEEIELIEQGREQRLAATTYELQEALGLPHPPVRIEGYDISNIQGTLAVGSQVVFRNGQPYKSGYRHYRIRPGTGPDDFAMLAEVLSRRAAHAQRDPASVPDLLLIDGGRGQVNRVAKTLADTDLSEIPVVGLAKREEELFLPEKSEPIRLPKRAPALQLLQRVRDEAHRFAVTYHRKLRSQIMREDPLAGVPGLGPRKHAALLAHFGSLARVLKARPGELRKAPGIGPKLASMIVEHLAKEAGDE